MLSGLAQCSAWRRDVISAFDANDTNFIRCEADSELYSIDLIVWPLPD